MNYKKLFLITPKNDIKPVLNYLYVKNGKVYATDSYKAVIMNSNFDEEIEGFITKINAIVSDEKSKVNKVEILPDLTEVNEQYPDIEKVIPEEDFSIKLNRQYLVDLLTALQKVGKYEYTDEIILSIPKDRLKPLIFKNNNGVGIIVPRS